jgi:hypothetical protein
MSKTCLGEHELFKYCLISNALHSFTRGISYFNQGAYIPGVRRLPIVMIALLIGIQSVRKESDGGNSTGKLRKVGVFCSFRRDEVAPQSASNYASGLI